MQASLRRTGLPDRRVRAHRGGGDRNVHDARTARTVTSRPGQHDHHPGHRRSRCADRPRDHRSLRTAADRGTRIASLCVGAFTLADTGLLDGLRATTHWAAASELARRHPAIDVDAAVLYVDNGHVLTSAGAAAALDLCLYMVRQDYGSAVAADTARLSVMPLERAGGQAQFIVHEPPVPSGTTLRPLLNWMEENLGGEQLDITTIAAKATMSTRTLNRRFQEQIGTTPLQWLHHARLRQAQFLLETTDHSIERVAGQVGFNAVTTFRERFRDLVGTSPQRYRTQFRTSR